MKKFAYFFVFCFVALAVCAISQHVSAHDHNAHFQHHNFEADNNASQPTENHHATREQHTHTHRINCNHNTHNGVCTPHTTKTCDEHQYICCEKPSSITHMVSYTGRRHSLAEKIHWPCKTITDLRRPTYSMGLRHEVFLWWTYLRSHHTGWRTKLYSESPRLRI